MIGAVDDEFGASKRHVGCLLFLEFEVNGGRGPLTFVGCFLRLFSMNIKRREAPFTTPSWSQV